MVPPASHKIPRASWYSGSRPLCSAFRLRGFYPLSLTFPGNSTRPDFDSAGPQPRKAGASRFGLCPLRSPLLWASRLISLPPGTEMFHFPGLASLGLCIQLRMMGHDSHRVSPFRNHRIVGCLAPPRCLSQLTASFIASQRQGIHLLPLISYFSRTLLFPSHSPIQL